MFATFFSVLAVTALLSSFCEILMRVRLTKRESAVDKLLWWRSGGDDVAAMHQDIFPGTRLPLFRQIVFWLFLTCALVLVILVLWR
jgi:hypothetical protein